MTGQQLVTCDSPNSQHIARRDMKSKLVLGKLESLLGLDYDEVPSICWTCLNSFSDAQESTSTEYNS